MGYSEMWITQIKRLWLPENKWKMVLAKENKNKIFGRSLFWWSEN